MPCDTFRHTTNTICLIKELLKTGPESNNRHPYETTLKTCGITANYLIPYSFAITKLRIFGFTERIILIREQLIDFFFIGIAFGSLFKLFWLDDKSIIK